MSELFRREAVHHATRRLAGEVVLAAPLRLQVLAGLVVAVVLGGAAFAASATYARKETVPGWLNVQGGLIRVTARVEGTISAVHVREGQAVQAGQPLMTLQLSTQNEGGDVGAALAAGLQSEAAAAIARSNAQRAKLLAEATQYEARREALAREVRETEQRVALQRERVRLAQLEVTRAQEIADQGFLPRRELDARRSAALAAEGDLAALRGSLLALQREMGDIASRLRSLPADIQAIEADAATARAGIAQKRTETQARRTYVATATVAGQVAAITAERGQTVPAGASLAVLTPGGAHIEAELYAPSRAAGFIRAGQEVRLMYQAFPHQKFGAGEGVVTSVSRTVLAPGEVTIPGLQLQEPVFRVRARLKRDSVSAYGEEVPLQPGMVLNADVVIDRRTLFEWLLDPLFAAGRRG